jgi:hypothetical protein
MHFICRFHRQGNLEKLVNCISVRPFHAVESNNRRSVVIGEGS